MKAIDLLSGINYECIFGDLDVDIDKVVLDSRKVLPGTAFVAMIGQRKDGHKYLVKAANQGASLIVVDARRVEDVADMINTIIDQYMVTVVAVADSRKAFSDMACTFFDHPARDMKIIGLTGTKGKTTSTYIVNEILNYAGMKCGLIGSVENRYGDHVERSEHTTPEAWEFQEMLTKMKSVGVTHCVMEVSSLGLKFNRTDGVDFEVGIFTNFLNDHISPEEHPTEDDYFDSKMRLFDHCRIALINKNTQRLTEVLDYANDHTEKVYTYSFTGGMADFYVKEFMPTSKDGVPGMKFIFVTPTYESEMFIPLICDFNVDNALCAASCAYLLGIPEETIREGMLSVKVPGRMEKVDNNLGLQVYVDYAHNGDSLRVLLRAVRRICKGRIITVFGCGGDRPTDRRFTMGEVSGRYSDLTIVTTDNSRSENFSLISGMIVEGIRKAPNAEFAVIEDRREAIDQAIAMATPDDIVVIAGKGHEQTMEILERKVHFVDAEEAADSLRILEKERKADLNG
ncbi:MAG: UDP-N-acetylmuramoyl-L-alanyl-D-glutamate--2,6-diaminopimelate ligase [Clostridiales bacterium]|nr:UDP-N-acetylmuramoyl-L-alanyl-D-glutamate--2,6-diaminopimelate ligase [Clostridiales bacterium]